MPFYSVLGEGSPTKIDYRKKGTLILTSLLEDLVKNMFYFSLLLLKGVHHYWTYFYSFQGAQANGGRKTKGQLDKRSTKEIPKENQLKHFYL